MGLKSVQTHSLAPGLVHFPEYAAFPVQKHLGCLRCIVFVFWPALVQLYDSIAVTSGFFFVGRAWAQHLQVIAQKHS